MDVTDMPDMITKMLAYSAHNDYNTDGGEKILFVFLEVKPWKRNTDEKVWDTGTRES